MKQPPLDLESANATLTELTARERLKWAADTFGENLFLLSSMQKTASVLMHMFHDLGLSNEVLFVDTGYHFFETLRLRDEIMRKLSLKVVTLYPALTVEAQEEEYQQKLYACADGQPECCRIRKEEPLLAYLKQTKRPVLAGGRRRAEGGKRAHTQPLARDPRIDGYSLSPLFDWTDESIDAYVKSSNVPVHALHARCYPSIGCYPCTTPVRPGESPRAGRWRHLREEETDTGPAYCGINFTDGGGI